ncbi:hypothetical protein OAJ17_03185 [Acidimicrobiaceae bacterium]|nr:hypothetical protein [Acidimicrobiaceae bacterium]
MKSETINEKKNIIYLKIIFLSIFILLPWIWNMAKDALPIIEVSPASVGYYQTNICDISFIKLMFSSFFNDSLVLTATNVDNIGCVGKIMGMDNINGKIAVYIGTNLVVDILFQSIFWLLLMSFIKKDTVSLKSNYLPILIVPLIFCLQIVGEKRFYALIHKGYKDSISSENYYLLNYFLAYIIIAILIKEFIVPRASNLVNFLPFIFLIVGTYNLININMYLLIVSYFGVVRLQQVKHVGIINYFYLFMSTMWLALSDYQNSYFDVDKLRGFTNSSSTLPSKLFWIIVVFLSINGLWYLFEISKNTLDLEKLRINFLISGSGVVFFGIIGAANPIINFINQYYFGQNKKGIDKIQSIDGNTWRGFSSSAEAVGEFFAFVILLNFLVLSWKKNKLKLYEILFLILCIYGLFKANNSAAMISLATLLFFLLFKKKMSISKRKLILLLSFISIILFTVIYLIIDYFSYGSLSKGLLYNAFEYSNVFISSESYFNNLNYFEDNNIQSILLFKDQGESLSVSLKFLVEKFTPENNLKFIPNPVAFISFISVIINRSEKWGLFVAKYNPEVKEFLFGFGPLQFDEYYASNSAVSVSGLILPHSSLLDLLIFSGIIGVSAVLLYFIYTIRNYKESGSFVIYLLFFQIINILKSDSIVYISSLFLLIFTIYCVKNSDEFFEADEKIRN